MNAHRSSPWYREPLVWLLIAFPLASVIGGMALLWLALQSDDGLVVDDYYRRGKEINRELSRDQAAAARALKARLLLDEARRAATIELDAAPARLPAQLDVQFLHATRHGHDRRLLLARGADGRYRAALAGLVPGRYHVQLAAEDWRLTGSLRVPGDGAVEILAAVPR